MGDLFAFLLKTRFLAKEKSAEQVIAALSPVLSQLAAAKDTTEGELVADLMCDYLESQKEDVIPLLKAADKGTDAKMKGFDKVSDDCLKLALEYLCYKDRCNGVELTCHRLLQLSRAAPFHCQSYGGEICDKRMYTQTVARRFRTGIVELNYARDWWNYYRKQQSTDLSTASDSMLRLTYPRLKRAIFEYNVSEVSEFLRRNPHIEEFGFGFLKDSQWLQHGADVLMELSNCKKVRAFELTSPVAIDFDAKEVDISHITEAKWKGYEGRKVWTQMCDFPWLFHDELQSLTLTLFECEQNFAFLAKYKWESLRKLKLEWCHTSLWKAFASVKLEHCCVYANDEEFITALCTFAAHTLEYTVSGEPTYDGQPNGCYYDFEANSGIKQLSVVFKDKDVVWQFAEFVRWLSRNVHRFGDDMQTTVRMPAEWLSIVNKYYRKYKILDYDFDVDSDDCDSPVLVSLRSDLDLLRPHVVVLASTDH